jgi:hypothetical protein
MGASVSAILYGEEESALDTEGNPRVWMASNGVSDVPVVRLRTVAH